METRELEMALETRSSFRIESILRLYAVLGGLVAVGGFLYFAYLRLGVRLSSQEQIALLVAGVGIMMSAMSLAFIRLRREHLGARQTLGESAILQRRLLHAWAEFEAVAKSRLEAEGSEMSRHSIRRLMEFLAESEILDQSTLRQLSGALSVRNDIAHGRADVPDPVLIELIREVKEAIRKMDDRGEPSNSVQRRGSAGR